MGNSGRQMSPDAVWALVSAFNAAFNRQDIDAVMGLMTEDAVFENTFPSPDGTRYTGQKAVRAAFQDFFRASPQASFEVEAYYAAPAHCTVRWLYHWHSSGSDKAGHVRGIDVFEIRDEKIAAKYSYVKG